MRVINYLRNLIQALIVATHDRGNWPWVWIALKGRIS